MGQITGLVHEIIRGPTPLQREISWVSRVLGALVLMIAAIVIVTIVVRFGIACAHDVVTVVLFGVSLAVAAVPEGLPAPMSVVLTLGVRKMADHGAIVKEMSSVEALGLASVVCCGKTGTLTTGELTVAGVLPPERETVRSTIEFGSDKRVAGSPEPVSLASRWTDAALSAAATNWKGHQSDGVWSTPVTDASRQASLVVLQGAPEAVWDRCAQVAIGDCLEKFDAGWARWVRHSVEALAAEDLWFKRWPAGLSIPPS